MDNREEYAHNEQHAHSAPIEDVAADRLGGGRDGAQAALLVQPV